MVSVNLGPQDPYGALRALGISPGYAPLFEICLLAC